MINQIRGLLAERGLIMARSPQAFKRAIPTLFGNEGSELTAFCQALLTEMLQHLEALEARIHWLEVSIKEFVKNSELCRKISQATARQFELEIASGAHESAASFPCYPTFRFRCPQDSKLTGLATSNTRTAI
ncbi:hypothetical protein [Burkholderia sp. L27(2015)]|uniref:hypothetical protein n=1 Tax=Burkholderia sp. L27(2015) TaxID=1641858 RepID=UPI00131DBA18|nr:hypothetical protein [Burkholderia sp. L27(2015)]